MKTALRILFVAALAAIAASFAAESTTETVTVERVTRIFRVSIFAAYNADPTVEIQKERLRVLGGSVIGREQLPSVTRTFSAVAAQTVTLTDGTVISGAQVQEAIIRFAAKWQVENDTPPPPPPPAEPEPTPEP